MSDTSQISFKVESKKRNLLWAVSFVCKPFDLNGHFNYAFIYGSWEVVRARKVGTTHTNVDYVVYRLFYPVLLIGACLFVIVADTSLVRFFCRIEVWSTVFHISYALIFLQNVLTNNLHREPVRGRQKIPERLIVTDEIEKGGHKLYICKRFSILPIGSLYYTEQLLWLMFNIISTVNVAIWIAILSDRIKLTYSTASDLEKIRAMCTGSLALADVVLTPIPMRLAHVIYPLCYSLVYTLFLYLIFIGNDLVLYVNINWGENAAETNYTIFLNIVFVAVVYFILVGISKLRDYVIAILDDSRTAKQMQSLRSQKRLARRKLMNYIEGPDGRIIGIALEKHTHAQTTDEFIRTETKGLKATLPEEDDEEESEEVEKPKKSLQPEYNPKNMVPVSNMVKPPPPPRYTAQGDKGMKYSSSSTSSETKLARDLEAVANTRLPSPPKEPVAGRTKNRPSFKSRIPLPLYKLGAQLKPRDSKEEIHHRFSIERNRSESPPTPPFVKVVQTMMKFHQDAKGEVAPGRNMGEEKGKKGFQTGGLAHVKVVRTGDRETRNLTQEAQQPTKPGQKQRDIKSPKDSTAPPPPSRNFEDTQPALRRGRFSETGSAGRREKRVAAKVIATPGYINDWKARNRDIFRDFHSELIHKLQKEKDKTQGMGDTPGTVVRTETKLEQGKQPTTGQQHPVLKKSNKKRHSSKQIKGILKRSDEEGESTTATKDPKKRTAKIVKRRVERIVHGKHGKPVYDPLVEPNIEQKTTFHYLGTKLKGEKAEKHVLNPGDLHIYKSHPGIGPMDGPTAGILPAQSARSLVAFHPIVRYFDVNETVQEKKKVRIQRKD